MTKLIPSAKARPIHFVEFIGSAIVVRNEVGDDSLCAIGTLLGATDRNEGGTTGVNLWFDFGKYEINPQAPKSSTIEITKASETPAVYVKQ